MQWLQYNWIPINAYLYTPADMAEHLKQPRSLISMLFTVGILAGAGVVLSPFLLSILWAAIITMAFWHLHTRVKGRFPGKNNTASFVTTLMVAILLVGPMIGLLVFMIRDIVSLTVFLMEADQNGIAPPQWLARIPLIGKQVLASWNQYLSVPNQLSMLLQDAVATKLGLVQEAARSVLVDLLGRVATLFFALWVLFFFFRDGQSLSVRFNQIGQDWLGQRWFPYVSHVPPALRAAINGLVIVSFAEAVILSALLTLCDVPAPVLLGSSIALIAFVPMAAPGVLLVLGILLFAADHVTAAVVVMSVGMLVVLLADYLVRPLLIQEATHLPFLAVLFGVFGGVLTMGIVGLIIGPVLLVLLLVFFDEASHPHPPAPPSSE